MYRTGNSVYIIFLCFVILRDLFLFGSILEIYMILLAGESTEYKKVLDTKKACKKMQAFSYRLFFILLQFRRTI